VVKTIGNAWKEAAIDRSAWINTRGEALKNFMLDHGLKSPEQRKRSFLALGHISTRLLSMSQGTRMSRRMPVTFIVDNLQVAMQGSGLWALKPKAGHSLYIERLRWGLYMFEHRLKFFPLSACGNLLLHRTREFNSLCDSLANHVLDRDIAELKDLCTVDLGTCVALWVSSDGACRGNPGVASAAAAIQCLLSNGATCIVARHAVSLGHSNSVFAELEAAVMAQTLLLSWSIRNGLCHF
jgi:hypothetical protein